MAGAAGATSPVEAQHYAHRVQLRLLSERDVAAGAPVTLKLDTRLLVRYRCMKTDGSDLRVWYWNGRRLVELPRQLSLPNFEYTTLKFRLEAPLRAGKPDENYYLLYGNPQAEAPPEVEIRETSEVRAQRIGKEFPDLVQTVHQVPLKLAAGTTLRQTFVTGPWVYNLTRVDLCIGYTGQTASLNVTVGRLDPEVEGGFRPYSSTYVAGTDIPQATRLVPDKNYYWVPFYLWARLEPNTAYVIQVQTDAPAEDPYTILAANVNPYRPGELLKNGQPLAGHDLAFVTYSCFQFDERIWIR